MAEQKTSTIESIKIYYLAIAIGPGNRSIVADRGIGGALCCGTHRPAEPPPVPFIVIRDELGYAAWNRASSPGATNHPCAPSTGGGACPGAWRAGDPGCDRSSGTTGPHNHPPVRRPVPGRDLPSDRHQRGEAGAFCHAAEPALPAPKPSLRHKEIAPSVEATTPVDQIDAALTSLS